MAKNIVMLLAVPRSGSTVTEMIFCGSGYFESGLHEPNADHYYLDKKITSTDKSKFKYTSYEQFKADVLLKAKTGRVFIKDMVHHFFKDISEDMEFAVQIDFIFLIRDPIPTIRSHLTANPQVSSEEIGFNKLHLFSVQLQCWGMDYRVISYELILENQLASFKALFDYLDLEFKPEMLDLKANESLKAQMEKFGPWHEKALKSAHIETKEATYSHAATDPLVQSLYNKHRGAYLRLKSQLIQLQPAASQSPVHTKWLGIGGYTIDSGIELAPKAKIDLT